MKQYKVTGMSCAACSARVEKAVRAVDGVTECSVNLLTGVMGVEGTAPEAAVIRAVTDAGYGASVRGAAAAAKPAEDEFADRETPVLKKRLLSGAVFLLLLMYFSMGHDMRGWPVPAFFDNDPVACGLLQMLLASVVMLINRKFFISGFRGLMHRAPNMDTLVALGSSASFAWSVYALFMMTDAQVKGGTAAAAAWTGEFYFGSAAMILVLITVGKLLEAKSKGKTTDALKALMKLAPKTAVVVRDGKEQTVPVEEVRVGDIFAVRPGESIPVDGVVIEGDTAVNEAALTGESIPADKTTGDGVSAATVNQSGYILCKATRVGEDTTLSQIIKTVSDAAATKAPAARLADKVSGVFVPAVTGIAAVTLIVWLMLGKPFDYALARAVSVLVISCPCALGLATPVAIMVGNGVGAKHGILFRTAASLEQTGKTRIAALDKTGTITKGQPEVTEIVPAPGVTEEALLAAACAIECRSEHPLASAVMREAEKRGLTPAGVSEFRAFPGRGVCAVLNGKTVYGGSAGFIGSITGVQNNITEIADRLSDRGETPLLFAENEKLLGAIAVADTVKEDSAAAVKQLEELGIRVVMLTGDNIRTAKAVARQAGIENVIAGVLPDGKEAVIRRLRELGAAVMVGDGINDAPALTAADTGIAIGAGADIAAEAADVVLINSRLTDVPAAIRLSRAVLADIRQNLFWAFCYNVICIPLAAGAFTGWFGRALDPMAGAAAMSLSSFFVVMNALRLNLIKLYPEKRGKKRRGEIPADVFREKIEEINQLTEEKKMTKTIKIEGMMCPHCEAHTKQALEALDGVESAAASHEAGNAVVILAEDIDDAVLTDAVEKAGYKVLGIE